jgi:maltose-binding protein MalE
MQYLHIKMTNKNKEQQQLAEGEKAMQESFTHWLKNQGKSRKSDTGWAKIPSPGNHG